MSLNKSFCKVNLIKSKGFVYLILSIIFSTLSLFFNHIVFGMLGVAAGLIAYKEGHYFGAVTSAISVIFMFVGLILSTLIESYFKLLLNVFLITG